MAESQDIYDPAFVKDVFDRCSGAYITFSYLCSFGFTERWRRQAVEQMPAPPSKTPIGYDLMAGTGEVWPHVLKAHPGTQQITAIDISSGMHRRALERLHALRQHKIGFVEGNVLDETFSPEGSDFIISTFGLKTFNPSQQEKLAALVQRSLKPGGVFSFIEASDPRGWILRPLYRLHLKVILPLIEKLFLRGAQDFSMIGTYTSDFGNVSGFAAQLRSLGLEVEEKRYFFGCATGVAGRKPK